MRCTAHLAHAVIQSAHGGDEVKKPQLPHECADATLRKPCLITAVIGVEAKFHVPGIGVPVGGFERCRGFHAIYILSAEFLLPLMRQNQRMVGVIMACR